MELEQWWWSWRENVLQGWEWGERGVTVIMPPFQKKKKKEKYLRISRGGLMCGEHSERRPNQTLDQRKPRSLSLVHKCCCIMWALKQMMHWSMEASGVWKTKTRTRTEAGTQTLRAETNFHIQNLLRSEDCLDQNLKEQQRWQTEKRLFFF